MSNTKSTNVVVNATVLPEHKCNCGNKYVDCEVDCGQCPSFLKYRQEVIDRAQKKEVIK